MGSVVIFTGAGVSVPSGLRPYRGVSGLWTEHPDLEALSNEEAIAGNLEVLWSFWGDSRRQVAAAEPNRAHLAIAGLQQRRTSATDVTVVTMNVDGLHQRAGATGVLEVHGNLHRSACLDGCGQVDWPDATATGDVPVCPTCGGPARPAVVMFGERPVLDAMWLAKRAVRTVGTFISVGTSDMVSTGTQLAYNARFAGARMIQVNVEPPLRPDEWDEVVLGSADETLPELLERF